MTNQQKVELLNLINRALDGNLGLHEACRFLSELRRDEDKEIQDVAHDIVHFLTDADLRGDDKDYDALLRKSLTEAKNRMSD